MKWMLRLLAPVALVVGFVLPAHSADLLVLSEDVPAGLDYDGPAGSLIPSYTGMVNLLEPLVYFSKSGMSEEGVYRVGVSAYRAESRGEYRLVVTFSETTAVPRLDGTGSVAGRLQLDE